MLSKFQFSKRKAVLELNEVEEIEQESNEKPSNIAAEGKTEEKSLFNFPSSVKNNKVLMDLILAIEQAAHQQQRYEYQMNELQNRFRHTSGQLDEQLGEVKRMSKMVESKNNHLDALERKITDQNLKFDQMMEDYQEMQTSLSNEIEDLKNMLNVEKRKNETLNEQFEKEVIDWVSKVKKKDEQILIIQSENDNLKEQNEHIKKENQYLRTMVNEFTSRMSASFQVTNNQ